MYKHRKRKQVNEYKCIYAEEREERGSKITNIILVFRCIHFLVFVMSPLSFISGLPEPPTTTHSPTETKRNAISVGITM